MADKLENTKLSREADLFSDILLSIRGASEGINEEYVISQLETYIRRQSLRSIAIDLGKLLQQDTDESLDEAERLFDQSRATSSAVFDPGLRLSDKENALSFLDGNEPAFPTGIQDLDKRGFGPTRKELWLYIAAAKRGKTWMLIQLAKMALIHRLRVCHVTLEMSEQRTAQRYFQAMFAMSKRNEKKIVTKFERDSLGRMTGFGELEIKPALSMDDPKLRQKLLKKVEKFGPRILDNIFIKQFPTGHLTVRQLVSYLDSLESNERFIPDLLIVDYPDLMKIDKDNYRLGIDEIYKEIRGIAVARNIAVAVVSQGNRSSEKAKNVGSGHVAEAWSKIAHADCVITYNQTSAEHQLGLARLQVTGGRNDEDKITIIVSQNYATGAFVVDSTLLTSDYWQHLPADET
jgi:replicative DNA helicase